MRYSKLIIIMIYYILYIIVFDFIVCKLFLYKCMYNIYLCVCVHAYIYIYSYSKLSSLPLLVVHSVRNSSINKAVLIKIFIKNKILSQSFKNVPNDRVSHVFIHVVSLQLSQMLYYLHFLMKNSWPRDTESLDLEYPISEGQSYDLNPGLPNFKDHVLYLCFSNRIEN